MPLFLAALIVVRALPAMLYRPLAERRSQLVAAGLLSAALFVVFVATGSGSEHAVVTRVEVGYLGATAVLAGLLWVVYRLGPARPRPAAAAPSGA